MSRLRGLTCAGRNHIRVTWFYGRGLALVADCDVVGSDTGEEDPRPPGPQERWKAFRMGRTFLREVTVKGPYIVFAIWAASAMDLPHRFGVHWFEQSLAWSEMTYILLVLVGMLMFADNLWVIADKQNQSLHDEALGALVVDTWLWERVCDTDTDCGGSSHRRNIIEDDDSVSSSV